MEKMTRKPVQDCSLEQCELEAIYQRGYDFWHEECFELATECFAEIALRNPLEYRFVFALACAMKQQGAILHAVKLFMHSLIIKADEPWIYFHLGDCLQSLGKIPEASEALEAAVRLCDGQPDYQYLLQQATRLLTTLHN